MNTCFKCGREIENHETCFFEVTGWEKSRSDGGANAISLRKRTGLVMCIGCMTTAKSGLPPEGLF